MTTDLKYMYTIAAVGVQSKIAAVGVRIAFINSYVLISTTVRLLFVICF